MDFALNMVCSAADALLGPGNSILEQKVALQIEGIAGMEVLKPLVQALLPYEAATGHSQSGKLFSGHGSLICTLSFLKCSSLIRSCQEEDPQGYI